MDDYRKLALEKLKDLSDRQPDIRVEQLIINACQLNGKNPGASGDYYYLTNKDLYKSLLKYEKEIFP